MKKTKICTKCHVRKPLTAFHKQTAAKDGLYVYCKECAAKYNRVRRAANPERGRANDARWVKENPERRRASAARYAKQHPAQFRERNRRRRANKRAVSEHFTPEMEQFVKAAWGNQCTFCSSTKKLCIDHWRPLSKGHALTMGNAVLLCNHCNTSKGNKRPEDLDNQIRVAAIERQLVEQAERWEDCERLAFSSAR